MMASLKESLAGPGYVILNAIRVINIIVFLDMIAAHVVLLIRIDLLTSFFFFQAVGHAVAIGICISLLVSELPFPVLCRYINRYWPSLGEDSGFLALAFAMLILGITVLGDLNTPATSQEELGLTFWRIIISAGILALVVSVVNLAANFAFADRDIGVSARHVRAYGAVAPQKVASVSGSQRSFKLSAKKEESLPSYSTPSPMRRASTISRFPVKISPPQSPTRMPNASDPAYAPSSKYSRDTSGVTMPNLAHHPAMMHGDYV